MWIITTMYQGGEKYAGGEDSFKIPNLSSLTLPTH